MDELTVLLSKTLFCPKENYTGQMIRTHADISLPKSSRYISKSKTEELTQNVRSNLGSSVYKMLFYHF